MNIKEQILKHYDAWTRQETTPERIANRVGTTKEYVMQVFNYKDLKEELANREPVFYPDLTEEEEIIEPDYIECQEITLLPKVNQLAGGRIELIYESKMNYE